MSTTINPENYNWTVTNAVAKPVIQGHDANYPPARRELEDISYHSNAPNGQYPGDAFEVEKQFYNEGDLTPKWEICHNDEEYRFRQGMQYNTRVSLRIKRSHLPQVLKEADYNSWTEGGELKELYNEVWQYQGRDANQWLVHKEPELFTDFKKYSDFMYRSEYLATRREYRLTNTPPVQEAETVEDKVSAAEYNIVVGECKRQAAEIADLNKQVDALKANSSKISGLLRRMRQVINLINEEKLVNQLHDRITEISGLLHKENPVQVKKS